QQQCDVWVLEVGLGGRLDVVNVIDPNIAVITNIGLDHTDWLGDTIEKIAFEKAGIIRPHIPVIFAGEQSLPQAIQDKANSSQATLY
ncbi:Mur ligase family protein, partial [Acinetobacter baumannii]